MCIRDRSGSGDGLVSYDIGVVSSGVALNFASSGAGGVSVVGTQYGVEDVSGGVRVGGSACGSSEWTSDSALLCQVEPGVGSLLGVAVSVDMLSGTGTRVFSYDRPRVTHVNPANVAITGGGTVYVYGSHFGVEDYGAVVSIGETMCSATTYTTNTFLQCTCLLYTSPSPRDS